MMSSVCQENKNDLRKRGSERLSQNLTDFAQRKSNAFLELCKKNSTIMFQNKTLPSQKGTDKKLLFGILISILVYICEKQLSQKY